MFYLAFFVIYLIYLFNNRIPNKLGFAIQMIPMILIITFRFGYGADYFSYALAYDSISGTDVSQILQVYPNMEIGFKFFVHLVKSFGFTYQQFLIIVNSLMLLMFMIPVYKYSEDSSLSILMFYSMFFFVWILSGIRQGVSMSLSLLLLITYLKSEKKYSLFQIVLNIILFIIAISFHMASLYVLVLLLVTKINWSRKVHLILFVTSLIVSQFQIVLFVIKRIPILANSKTLVYYMSGNVNIFDFPGLIRMSLFILVLFLYDYVVEDKFYKKITDIFLVATSVYFLLKFSELTASRTHIYAFILLLLIVPYLLKQLNIKHRLLINLGMFIPMFMYFNKELITMDSQAGLYQPGIIKGFPTRDKYSFYDFDDQGSFRLGLKEENIKEQKKYVESVSREYVDYSPTDQYTVVRGNFKGESAHFLVNQDGNIMESFVYKYQFEYLDGIVYYFSESGDPTMRQHTFVDITGENRSKQELVEEYNKSKAKEYLYNRNVIKTNLTYADMDPNTKLFFQNEEQIGPVDIYKMDSPFEYYLMVINYHDGFYFVYFDENKEIMFDNVYTSPSEYDVEGFIKLNTNSGVKIYSTDKKLVWWQ